MRDHGITVQNITISDQMLLYDLLFNYWELTGVLRKATKACYKSC